jgi:hypothetical protein
VTPLKVWLAEKNVFLTKNDRRLWALKDKHKGEDAVVIGMGPSLRPEDLDRFENFVSFACNKIHLAYDQTKWRPDYYSVIDVVVIENNYEEIGALKGSTKIFPSRWRRDLPHMEDALYFRRRPKSRKVDAKPEYTDNPLCGVLGGGATVLIPLIQMAYWMGCKSVYLVGLDFSFKLSQSTTEKSKGGAEILSSNGETNHFHKDYRKKGEKWTAPKMDQQEHAFEYARRAFEAGGRKLLNASRKTKLEVIEKVDFEEVFPSKS